MNKLIGCTIQPESVSAVILTGDGKVVNKVMDDSNTLFDKTVSCLKSGENDEAIKYLMGYSHIVESVENEGFSDTVKVSNGIVLFNGIEIDNALTQRLLRMLKEGFNVEPLVNFLKNLMQNPSYTAVQELYLFLEANNLAITEDGCFLAYKSVNANFTSIHDGKTDNTIGIPVKMPRNLVDDKRENTCSNGLHFASLDYCKHHFTGDRILALKINPRDVVSIPHDYNNQKGRACEYVAIAEVTDEVKNQNRDPLSEQPVFNLDLQIDISEQDNWSWSGQQTIAENLREKAKQQIRDAKGRFIKKT